ncbi:MAG: hypothetical protein K1X72_28330 [Pyrinomonadaceae bacterium]|nr:hypothetical protein [Pyrinomonadaceae bacterium]
MTIEEAKSIFEKVEPLLQSEPFVVAHTFERNGKKLNLCLTERLRRIAKRGRVWKSNRFLTAIKNAEYGFDETKARSRGGSDGIFLLDRNFAPPNAMMRKIFDQYLDKETEEVCKIAKKLKTNIECFRAVRLVSHHFRLLGILHQETETDWLILVDYDDTK